MKNLKLYFGFLTVLLFCQTSCNESEFLDEKPLEFYSPENSFTSYGNFESAVVDLYAQLREYKYSESNTGIHAQGTDVMHDGRESTAIGRIGNYVTALNPTSDLVRQHWIALYKIVTSANSILDRLNENSVLTPEQKILIEGESRFFRAYAYRYLVHLYGGVPLLLNEVTAPKTDFSRAKREEVLAQIITDATIAANNLPSIGNVADGRLSDLVAHHLLAETYIAQKNWDKAIVATSVVIDDPNTSLMTTRFGSRANEPGDVYYDLFRQGNQNRKNGSGNKEALWVAQMEVDVPGGYLSSTARLGNIWERAHVPATWTLTDPDGKPGFITKRSDANIGGNGTSWLRPTNYMENLVWQSDFTTDIRNSPHNYIRNFIYDNPASAYFGKSILQYPSKNQKEQSWRWYPWMTKATTPGKHPDALFIDPALKLLKDGVTGSTYTDSYYHRLAETYLLRAEAYLGKGVLDKAADDINAVRKRANATLVSPGNVTIDYILDERARELNLEEDRRITLSRLGKLVERVRLFNKLNGDEIQNYHALWPIPARELEANYSGDMKQNPGYN